MAPNLDPKTDFQVTTIRRILVDRARGLEYKPYPGSPPRWGDFVVLGQLRCIHLGPDFTAVLKTAWQNGVPEDLTYDWVDELLDRSDLFPVAGPAKYILDLEAAYNFVKAKHPRAMITRFWTNFDWESAPRVGGFIIDTLQQILKNLPKSPSYAELGEKLCWGEILRWGARRLMVLDSGPDDGLLTAWPNLHRLPVPRASHRDDYSVALDLMSSVPGVFPCDGCTDYGISSYYDYSVIDLDEAYKAVMHAHPWARIERTWDSWDWSKAGGHYSHEDEVADEQRARQILGPELDELRQDNAKLRQELEALRQRVIDLAKSIEPTASSN
jgi:hypothetical protein